METSKMGAAHGTFAPVRSALLLLACSRPLAVQLLRRSDGAMLWIYSHISRPYHAFMSRLCSHFSFSAAELYTRSRVTPC